MHKTKIDWCDFSWNPVWGCLNSCPYCYARAIAKRFDKSFEPHWMPRNFHRAMPSEPARIFVNSMSEIAHWEAGWINAVLDKVLVNPLHTFLFLTKEPHVYQRWEFPDNCLLGVTVTRPRDAAELLPQLPRGLDTFVSYEPMLERIDPEDFCGKGLSWVILGAETGRRPGRVVPEASWIEPYFHLPIPVFMKANLPWDGVKRQEFPR